MFLNSKLKKNKKKQTRKSKWLQELKQEKNMNKKMPFKQFKNIIEGLK